LGKIGWKGMFALSWGALCPLVAYHVYKYARWRYDGCKNESYLCKENSMYFFEVENSEDEEG